MHRAGRRLRAEQVRGADLHAGRAERQRRRRRRARRRCRRRRSPAPSPRARSAAPARACRPAWSRSSDRNMPRWPPASSPCAMIASTPRASSQRASSTVVADERTFAPQRPHPREQLAPTGSPKWKLTTGGRNSLEHVGGLVASNGARPAPAGIAADVEPELRVVRRERGAPRGLARGVGRRRRVAEEVDVERPRRLRADRRELGAHRVEGEHARTAASRARRRSTRRSRARCPARPPSAPG